MGRLPPSKYVHETEGLVEVTQPSWDEYFIRMAMDAATKSKDPSTKVGVVLVGPTGNVISTGFNGMPMGVRETVTHQKPEAGFFSRTVQYLDPDRWFQRPEKYRWIEHAERNALYNAARHGICTNGSRLYMNWAPCPCTDCARALIQCGVVEIVGPEIPFPGAGQGTHYEVGDIASIMLQEAGVKTRTVRWPK